MYNKEICIYQCCDISNSQIPWNYFQTEIFLFSTIMLILIVKKSNQTKQNKNIQITKQLKKSAKLTAEVVTGKGTERKQRYKKMEGDVAQRLSLFSRTLHCLEYCCASQGLRLEAMQREAPKQAGRMEQQSYHQSMLR